MKLPEVGAPGRPAEQVTVIGEKQPLLDDIDLEWERERIMALEPVAFRRGANPKDRLHLTLDAKVSPKGLYQEPDSTRAFKKGRWIATVPNSFGLPAGEEFSCPGETKFCEGCYAKNSERRGSVHERMVHNLEMLHKAGNVENMSLLLDEMVGRYSRYADEKDVSEDERIFRIHWDGDFFSEDYARAWAQTVENFPDISFWVYTRSFTHPLNVVPVLVGKKNLAVYLSVDVYNEAVARQVAIEHPEVMLALCAEDLGKGVEMRDRDPNRLTITCPENLGRLALMENGRGACVECTICPDAKADIIFMVQKPDTGNASPKSTGRQGVLFDRSTVIPEEQFKRPAN